MKTVAVVLAVVVASAGCGINSTVAGTAITATETAVTAGTPFRDGPMEFRVHDVSQVHQVGDPNEPGMSMNSKGIFLVVTMTIRNVGDAPRTFLDRDQNLIDSTGHTFSPDMAADIYANRSIRSTRITPGDHLDVHIVFDVPVGTVPKTLLLRHSNASAGVAIPLQ